MSDYSRGDYADLPAGTTDLENNYSAPDLTAIASNDNSTYANQTANNEIAIHQYKKTVTSQYTNILWSGKSSLAPSESPVIMEVYNVDLTAWEELDRDDSTAADTDFDLSYDNLATADYLDSGVITWRVWQAASAGTPVTKTIGEGSISGVACDYTGCVDTWLSEAGPTNNYGAAEQMDVTNYSSGNREHTLIKFTGLSNLAGVTVTGVTLKLYIHRGNQINAETWTMRRLLKDWVVGEATWNKWKAGDSSTDWSTAGALNDLDRNNSVVSQTINVPLAPTGWLTITGDPNMIIDIQNMIDTPSANYGWIIDRTDANIEDSDYVQLESSNYVSDPPDYRPYLIVEGTQ